MVHPSRCPELTRYPELSYGAGAKWIKHITQDRLQTFLGGPFQHTNLSSKLFIHRMDGPCVVDLRVWSAPGLTKPLFCEAMQQTFKPAKKGDSFGPSWTNHWWKVKLFIPSSWRQYERVQFEFDPSCEAMIFSTDGVPLQGITGGYGVDRRVEHIIPRHAIMWGVYEIVIESSCNGMFGIPLSGDGGPLNMNRHFELMSADLVVPNQDAWHLMWDFDTLWQIVDTLPGNTPLQNKALVAANAIMNAFTTGNGERIKEIRGIADNVFGEGWQEKGAGIYKEGPKKAQVVAISNCHIDCAWLWPYSATQQKIARSWSTQIDLMERYPEHRFVCSQAQQFKWLEQQYPSLFVKVKAKIASGQFHLIGGSWVENDANMPSGEALVRQFLYGQRYFESRFGKRCETAWLPDSFGFTAAYPQLIREAGMKFFFTQKISWNNTNLFPHTTFNWVGLDGTQVLCHMTPVDTYTAQASVSEVHRAIANHKNLESSDAALLVFGNGDGGGGALPAMLENLRRIRAATNHHRELPPVSMGSTVEEFFEGIERDTKEGCTLPVWRGELYLELHRGTYTSHGSIKRGNRKCEILLREVERMATLATILKSHRSNYVYPKEIIDICWEKVLLNQFHDVLPGSGIGMVYKDADKLYSEVRCDCQMQLDKAFEVLLSDSETPCPCEDIQTSKQEGTMIAFNLTPFARQDVIAVPLAVTGTSLLPSILQTSTDGKHGYALVDCKLNSLLGETGYMLADYAPVSVQTHDYANIMLRTSEIDMTISEGRITSLYDVDLRRELIQKGSTGGLVIFEDTPNAWDAWDVEIHHLEMRTPLAFSSVRVIADGPLRASIEGQVKYGKSTITVTISLDALAATMRHNSRPFVRFDAVADWHEKHKVLKFELPLNINNTVATYECQFGFVQRPTHKNTTIDAAKFEVCGHKYADLSEYGYGVALLSESKYGFACTGNVLSISLLRAATSPDPEQDQGEHQFSWAVLPHVGCFLESDVPEAAYIFNSPLHLRHVPHRTASLHPHVLDLPFSVHGSRNIFLDTIKRGENDEFKRAGAVKTVVLRFYEAFGGHGRTELRIAPWIDLVDVYTANLLEDRKTKTGCPCVVEDMGVRRLELEFRGFEVKTVVLVLAPTIAWRSRRGSWVMVDKDSNELDTDRLCSLS